MLSEMFVFMTVTGTIVFAGFIAAYISHKWDD